MANSWGDIAVYDEMIADLGTFYQEIESAYNAMRDAAGVCVTELEQDEVSAKANKQVLMCCTKLEEVGSLVIALANALEEQKLKIIEALRKLDELDS